MKFRSYKNVLEELNKKTPVSLTISLWTYSSKRMTFEVPFDSIKDCFDWDMILTGNRKEKVVFTTVDGKQHIYWYNKLRIAKLDHVDIANL
jgi:hypothetical protein